MSSFWNLQAYWSTFTPDKLEQRTRTDGIVGFLPFPSSLVVPYRTWLSPVICHRPLLFSAVLCSSLPSPAVSCCPWLCPAISCCPQPSPAISYSPRPSSAVSGCSRLFPGTPGPFLVSLTAPRHFRLFTAIPSRFPLSLTVPCYFLASPVVYLPIAFNFTLSFHHRLKLLPTLCEYSNMSDIILE